MKILVGCIEALTAHFCQAARAARARARAGARREQAQLVHVVQQRPGARHQRARHPAPRAQPARQIGGLFSSGSGSGLGLGILKEKRKP